MDFKLAWRNIWRNPRRSILTMSAVAFATMLLVFMLSWQFGSYATMINASVRIRTGHLQVQAKGYHENREIRKVVRDPQAVGAILERTPGIKAYTYRAESFSLVSSKNRTYGALVAGIDPLREPMVSSIRDLVRAGSFLSSQDTAEAVVGYLLAKNFKAGVGDELVVLGQGRDGSIAATTLRIKGIFNSGLDEFDRGVMYIPLAYFQQVYDMNGAVNSVVAMCDSLDALPVAKQSIQKAIAGMPGLTVLDWKELTPGLVQAIKMDLVSGMLFYVILIVVVAFSIMNTFLMAIFERTREFGVMLAIGIRPGRLMRILVMESLGMTVIGVLAGIVAGSLVTWYFQVNGLAISGAEELMRQFGLPERMYPQLSLLSIGVGAGIVLILTCLTALYSAFRVRRLKPVQALTAV
ncbi:MAG: FtsX-like permease family protein [Geobacteraceae bacterium]